MTNPLHDHARDRVVRSLGTEAAIRRGLAPKGELPTPAELAAGQVAEAIAQGRMDLSGAPRWPFVDLDRLVGPMLPGDFVVLAALTGNGKSSFLMSAMDGWARRETSTLYIPLEMDPWRMRRKWAAWRLGLDPLVVARNELTPQEREAHEAELEAQIRNPYVHFVPDTKITMERIAHWMRWAVKGLAARQIVLDHFQRVDHGDGGPGHHLNVRQNAQKLRDLARELGIVVIAAAQILKNLDPLDAYKTPLQSRVQDSSGIVQEATIVLTLSRKLRNDVSKADLAEVKDGHKTAEEAGVGEPNIMAVCCHKNREEDEARGRRVLLAVRNRRVENLIQYERRGPTPPPPSEEDLWNSAP